jgi:hypothetical protein
LKKLTLCAKVDMKPFQMLSAVKEATLGSPRSSCRSSRGDYKAGLAFTASESTTPISTFFNIFSWQMI